MPSEPALGPAPAPDPKQPSSADALRVLVEQATRHFANLRRLSRQSFPHAGPSLAPFLTAVEALLCQLARTNSAAILDPAALAPPLAAAQEAVVHLDALMEAFSMRPPAG